MNREISIVIAIVVLLLLNIPFYLFLGKRFFGDWSGFCKAIDFLFTFQIISALKGELHDDLWAELKLGVFFVICSLSFLCPYVLIYLWIMSRG